MQTRIICNPESADRPLSDVPAGVACVVRSVSDRHLEDIGFLPGERVLVMVRGFPGGDPLAVRVGGSTFALRAAEAARIAVVPEAA
jgi:ferrous iron transport protein A